METDSPRPQNIIETTDALEAVSACQSMKNALFTVILLGLLMCQLVFWLNHFGLIRGPQTALTNPAASRHTGQSSFGPLFLAAAIAEEQKQTPSAAQTAELVGQVIDKVESGQKAQPQAPVQIVVEKETAKTPSDAAAAEPTPESKPAVQGGDEAGLKELLKEELALFHVSPRFAKGLVAVCNFAILAGAILYSLTLLTCAKISLAGRLGGMNHIVRAFFVSLFLLVFLIPWQVVLPKVLVGAVWLPSELLDGRWNKAGESVFWAVMMYLRFCGLWIAALWFLLWAQLRSAKWARAILRRLGVVR